jgi:hypothetical protein
VDTAEARQAAVDIARRNLGPSRRIDNNLDVESFRPTGVGEFVSNRSRANLSESVADLTDAGMHLEPDQADLNMHDPVQTPGPDSWGPDDKADEELEVYTPPSDPVVTVDERGRTQMLGGFGEDSMESIDVAPSAEDNLPGDEALADAIRRELREDAATTDLGVLVEVRRGVAHLRGRVAGLEDAEAAEDVASRVPGVREVVEEIEVGTL